MPNEGVSAVNTAYCSLGDVQARLFSAGGMGADQQAGNEARDNLLQDLIIALSRRFDDETERDNPGSYFPVYDQRVYSGKGAQVIEIDEFLSLFKVEQNTTQAQAPTWVDLTGDFATFQMRTLPLRFFPKTKLWRMQTFLVDAYRVGSVRISGIFGACQPDGDLQTPTAPWAMAPSLTQGQLNSLAPGGAGVGWWRTPDSVRKAVAEWTAYTWQAGRAGYSDMAGSPGATNAMYRKGIPPEVQMVIDKFRNDKLHLALIGIDGSDAKEDAAYPNLGSPDRPSRWGGWISNPPNNT